MAWTTPKTWAVREKVTAALLNTHLRDNLAWLRGMLDGTGSGTVTVPGALNVSNDANAFFRVNSGNVHLVADSNDYQQFDRTANVWAWIIGTFAVWAVDAAGKISGNGIVEVGEVTITNGSTGNLAHGLGATPRWVFARYNTVTGDSGRTRVVAPSYVLVTSGARIEQVGATNVVVINNTGATIYVKAWCIL